MMKHYWIVLFFLIIVGQSAAQDFDNYQLLKGVGTIPQEFLTPSSQKYEKAKASIDENEKREQKKDKEKFYLESNFLVDNLLQSGKVLFNDPITDYINKVADELLKDEKELRNKIRFYGVRSEAVNAFATNQGIIFVNVGLVAQLETEAQLAFILAHEIAHVKHKHALDMYMESQEIDRNTSRTDLVRQSSFDDRLIAKNYFSKELEMSADKLGLELYLDSKYKLADIRGVFDVLHYSYLPFDVNKFDKAFFETEALQLPDDYLIPQEEVNPIVGEEEDKDNPKSTHPSTAARRNACIELIANESDSGRKSYLAGDEATFLKMRDVARFEMCYYYLHQFRYQDALYAVFLLSEKYPNSRYLKKTKAKALYGYAKFKNEMKGIRPYSVSYSDDDIYVDNMRKKAFEKIEGPSQEVYYILTQMKPDQLTVLATRHIWDALATYPNDSELKDMQDDIFVELNYHYATRTEFTSITQEEEETQEEKTVGVDTTNQDSKRLSKYDKIKKKKKQNKKVEEDEIVDFAKYAFSDIVKSKAFKKAFEKGKEEKERINNRIEYYESQEGREQLRKQRKGNATALGIDSVLVITPYYLKANDSGGETDILFVESEERQKMLTEIIQKNAQIANLDVTLLNMTDIATDDTQKFNDLRLITEWISQQNRFGGNLLMKGFNQAAVDEIVKRYNKRYVLFTGVFAIQSRKTNWLLWSILFDMETGRYKVVKEDYYKRKDTKTMLNAHIYDILFQIKTQRKNKK